MIESTGKKKMIHVQILRQKKIRTENVSIVFFFFFFFFFFRVQPKLNKLSITG